MKNFMNYDVIVIGAGLGGLTAGAKLAKEGKKVLLIEQHDRPGGYATTFTRGDFTLEVGLHEMDGPAPGEMKMKIFNDLGVSGNVPFIPVPDFYRFLNNRREVTIPHDPEKATQILSRHFPGEIDGIKAYFDQILKPSGEVLKMDKQDSSIGEFLDSIIQEEDLKLILLGNLGYFHDDPYTLSLAYYSISQGSYYRNGASFIKGGSQQLSDYLTSYIREHDGEVRLNHLVTGILTENNQVKGVLLQQKNKRGAEIETAHAGMVIANNAMLRVADMLPPSSGEPFRNELTLHKTGASLLTVYYGFKRCLKDLGYTHYSTALFDDSVLSQKDILFNNSDDYQKRSFIFTDYSQLDSGLAPAGKSVAAVCCVDYLKDWTGMDRKAYLGKKAEVAATFTARLEKMIPGITENIEYMEVGTPYTCSRYTLNPEGAVYGFAQSPLKKSIDTSMLPDNLWFASAWGKTGGGFSGAIYGGYLCALQALRKKKAQ
jgi:phytoene dehydrogenase-like protein